MAAIAIGCTGVRKTGCPTSLDGNPGGKFKS